MRHTDEQLRLVRQHHSHPDRWCIQQLIAQSSSFKRDIWKPIHSQLSGEQAQALMALYQGQNQTH